MGTFKPNNSTLSLVPSNMLFQCNFFILGTCKCKKCVATYQLNMHNIFQPISSLRKFFSHISTVVSFKAIYLVCIQFLPVFWASNTCFAALLSVRKIYICIITIIFKSSLTTILKGLVL